MYAILEKVLVHVRAIAQLLQLLLAAVPQVPVTTRLSAPLPVGIGTTADVGVHHRQQLLQLLPAHQGKLGMAHLALLQRPQLQLVQQISIGTALRV